MSKKVVELFYDVVSPYSWLGFEVSRHFFCLFTGAFKSSSNKTKPKVIYTCKERLYYGFAHVADNVGHIIYR